MNWSYEARNGWFYLADETGRRTRTHRYRRQGRLWILQWMVHGVWGREESFQSRKAMEAVI